MSQQILNSYSLMKNKKLNQLLVTLHLRIMHINKFSPVKSY